MGLGWWLVGLICFITIVGIPWGKACFVIGQFCFFPFGKEAISRRDLTEKTDVGTGFWGSVGWWLAIGHVISALALFITIIGIPFGIQHLKFAKIALFPIGQTIVDKEVASESFMTQSLQGMVFAVTGAGGGIGRALALGLAKEGCSLAISDRDEVGLAQTVDLLKNQYPQTKVLSQGLDVTDEAGQQAWLARILAEYNQVDGVINNAGIALMGNFDEVEKEKFDKVVAVNLTAPINITRLFLPELKKRPWAAICNISSLFGLIAPVGNAAYAVAKFGLRGFNEVLRQELMPTNVKVISVHPGGIKTNIALNAEAASNYTEQQRVKLATEFGKALVTTPEKAASIIIEGIKEGKPKVIVGTDAKLADKGCLLALMDRDTDGLLTTQQMILAQQSSAVVLIDVFDITDETSQKLWLDHVIQKFGFVDALINNAGIGLFGQFADVSREQFEKVIAINLQAPIELTRLFLPMLKTRPWALVCNVSSLYGLIPPFAQSAYAVSKFGLRGFTEVLRQELMPTKVSVCCVHPGGVKTAIAGKAEFASKVAKHDMQQMVQASDKMLLSTPESAAKAIIAGIEKQKSRLIVGLDAKAMDFLSRLLPVTMLT
ncbi:unnamed protein product, partial [Darwinula stevensoni]